MSNDHLTPCRPLAVPVDVDAMGIDVLSISAHKLYGPKGIGALYVRRKPRVRLEPIISGGGQERGLRSGTVPAPLVVGFGEACRLAKKEMTVRSPFLSSFALFSACARAGAEQRGRDPSYLRAGLDARRARARASGPAGRSPKRPRRASRPPRRVGEATSLVQGF